MLRGLLQLDPDFKPRQRSCEAEYLTLRHSAYVSFAVQAALGASDVYKLGSCHIPQTDGATL